MVTFGTWSTAYQSKPIPWAPTPNNLVAALWSDLKMHNGRAYLLTLGTSPSKTCVIEWEIYDRNPSDPSAVLVLNFEIILYENTANILLQYKELDGIPAQYTVGIEDSDGVNGLQYLPALVEGNDIRFIRPDPGPRRDRLHLAPWRCGHGRDQPAVAGGAGGERHGADYA